MIEKKIVFVWQKENAGKMIMLVKNENKKKKPADFYANLLVSNSKL